MSKNKLKAEDHQFEWTVKSASSTERELAMLKKIAAMHRNHRKGSDI
jgi:hypothetical protein